MNSVEGMGGRARAEATERIQAQEVSASIPLDGRGRRPCTTPRTTWPRSMALSMARCLHARDRDLPQTCTTVPVSAVPCHLPRSRPPPPPPALPGLLETPVLALAPRPLVAEVPATRPAPCACRSSGPPGRPLLPGLPGMYLDEPDERPILRVFWFERTNYDSTARLLFLTRAGQLVSVCLKPTLLVSVKCDAFELDSRPAQSLILEGRAFKSCGSVAGGVRLTNPC